MRRPVHTRVTAGEVQPQLERRLPLAAFPGGSIINSMYDGVEFQVIRGELEEVVITFDRADEALKHAQALSKVEPRIRIRDDFERVHTIVEFDELFVLPWKPPE